MKYTKLVSESLNDYSQDFKKGDKVLVNSENIKDNAKYHENALKNLLGGHFKKEVHMPGNNDTLYNKALNGDVAIITWVEQSKNDNAAVNLIFDDGFECSTTKTSITKINQ